MRLTDKEKSAVLTLREDDPMIKFDDDTRSMYQFEVEKVSRKEYRVSKNAIICLKVEYFAKAEDAIEFIEKN